MRKLNQKYKGFTLMEVLLASTIFALILVFTTAAVSQSSNYQSKLSMINKTSEETRRLSDLITSSIREANSNLVVKAKMCGNAAAATNYNFKNGIAIIRSAGGGFCIDTSAINDVSDYTNSGFIVANKDGYQVFAYAKLSDTKEGLLYKKINTPASVDITNFDSLFPTSTDWMISKSDLLVVLKFGGFAPSDNDTNYGQPIVRFDIIAKSYPILGPVQNVANTAQSEIRSAVTSRSYN